MNIVSKVMVALVIPAGAFGSVANADILQEKKILEFNGPESRATCVKWAWGHLPFGKKWKTCIGHKYQFMAHQFYLVVDGPKALDKTVTDVVRDAFVAAVGVGIAAAAACPTPEPVSRAACGLKAARASFVSALKASALTRGLSGSFNVRIDHRKHW